MNVNQLYRFGIDYFDKRVVVIGIHDLAIQLIILAQDFPDIVLIEYGVVPHPILVGNFSPFAGQFDSGIIC